MASTAFSQDPLEEAYTEIGLSLGATQASVRVQIQAVGWVRAGSTTTQLETRIWREKRTEPETLPDRLYVESYVDGTLRHTVVADGRRVWRYDHTMKEYSFIPQSGGGAADAISSAVAWIRQDAQRPLRLLIPNNFKWLTKPEGERNAYGAEIRQLTWRGGEWRGTYLNWYFTSLQPLDRLQISERFEQPDRTLRESSMDVRLTYPTTPFEFEFKPNIPSDAKPAQDLPRRIIEG